MTLFLTSSAFTEDSSAVNPQNGLTKQLRDLLPQRAIRLLYITSDPDAIEITETYGAVSRNAFEQSDFRLERFTILDRRNIEEAGKLVASSDLLFFSGGHVPTQNRFFQEMNLKEFIRDFRGVMIGSSAGSMNAAGRVYSHPELEGEAIDPDYRRWLRGLGLTEIKILPHLNEVRHATVDGQRMFEDIAFPDSWGETFYALPDGSFFRVEENKTVLYGEAYKIRDGEMTKICDDGESKLI